MEIKLKLNDVIEIDNTIKSIIDNKEVTINVLLKFRLLGILKSIEQHITNFEIIKNEKIVEYGKKNKDGMYKIDKNDVNAIEKFSKDISQILNSEVAFNIEPFKPDEILDSELKAEYLMRLYPIIRK